MTEIKSLTGIRGIAALIVVWFHARMALESRGLSFDIPTAIERIFFSGGHSVDIFFVLSGFILAITYKSWFADSIKAERYFLFLRRRIARIYPLHFFMLLVAIALVTVARVLSLQTVNGLDKYDWATLPHHFLLIQAWGFLPDEGNWNPPSWSISIEAMAYLLLPVFVLTTAKLSGRRPWVLVLCVGVLGFWLDFLMPWATHGVPGLSRGLSEFFVGCASTKLLGSRLATWLSSTVGSWVALAGVIGASVITPDSGFVVGFATVPLLLALCGNNALGRFFAWRPIYFLGEISYSIYLGHFLLTAVIWRMISVEWMKAGVINAVLGVLFVNAFIIALSTLTYYVIERPGRALLSDRRRSSSAVGTADARA